MKHLIGESWRSPLEEQFNSQEMKELASFLKEQRKTKNIFPENKNVFAAFNLTPFDQVKVVIIGQDPYHGAGQAHGMSFSVPAGVKVPPSLRNIYKEIESDLGIAPPTHGTLENWAKQGVLLLNTVLTVEESKAGSHQKKGWEEFSDAVIKALNEKKKGLVFLLWGAPAQKKAAIVDEKRHYVLKAPHPSPLAAYRGFFGCKHFSKANKILKSKKINWKL